MLEAEIITFTDLESAMIPLFEKNQNFHYGSVPFKIKPKRAKC